MRLLVIGLLAFTTLFGATKAAQADDVQFISGQLSYLHGVVDPRTADLCDGPIPGWLFSGVQGPVKITASDFSAEGTGTAETCAFFEPVFGIYAQYSGTVTLTTSSGETLIGTFFGLDLAPIISDMGQPLVFETVAVMRLTDEEGEFVGLLTATGVDNPFGLPLPEPLFPCATEEDPAGVCASFEGVLVGDND